MLELLGNPPIALTLQSFTDVEFWTSVGILAGIYTIFTLGLQLNVGFTGIFNFGQAAFMAIGAYSMAVLVTEAGIGRASASLFARESCREPCSGGA